MNGFIIRKMFLKKIYLLWHKKNVFISSMVLNYICMCHKYLGRHFFFRTKINCYFLGRFFERIYVLLSLKHDYTFFVKAIPLWKPCSSVSCNCTLQMKMNSHLHPLHDIAVKCRMVYKTQCWKSLFNKGDGKAFKTLLIWQGS